MDAAKNIRNNRRVYPINKIRRPNTGFAKITLVFTLVPALTALVLVLFILPFSGVVASPSTSPQGQYVDLAAVVPELFGPQADAAIAASSALGDLQLGNTSIGDSESSAGLLADLDFQTLYNADQDLVSELYQSATSETNSPLDLDLEGSQWVALVNTFDADSDALGIDLDAVVSLMDATDALGLEGGSALGMLGEIDVTLVPDDVLVNMANSAANTDDGLSGLPDVTQGDLLALPVEDLDPDALSDLCTTNIEILNNVFSDDDQALAIINGLDSDYLSSGTASYAEIADAVGGAGSQLLGLGILADSDPALSTDPLTGDLSYESGISNFAADAFSGSLSTEDSGVSPGSYAPGPVYTVYT